jgi:hypothetical protein
MLNHWRREVTRGKRFFFYKNYRVPNITKQSSGPYVAWYVPDEGAYLEFKFSDTRYEAQIFVELLVDALIIEDLKERTKEE